MNLKERRHIYFIGIGGMGMSALARYFVHVGKKVAGYDRVRTPLTRELEDLGIPIHYEDTVDQVPIPYRSKGETLVVYTPAVPKANQELQYFVNQGFAILKRSEVLGLLTKDNFTFAVAGTHGKTTTCCILAHLLNTAGASFTAFLGGVSEDFGSNFVFTGDRYAVVEADEFDRSFLKLFPNIACIGSMDADHLDIYGTEDELIGAFGQFAKRIPESGVLLVRQGLPLEGTTYSIGGDADYRIENLSIEEGTYRFDIKVPKDMHRNITFSKPGRHNLLNALAAYAMAYEAGFDPAALKKGMRTFKGVKRRFSYQIREADFIFIDDYAHHPTEINAVCDALGEMHPGLRKMVVFQPHLFSRTKDFGDGFAKALARFDEVLLLDIYPAREEPIPGIDSGWLLDKMDHPKKQWIGKSQLLSNIERNKPDLLITLGAGDIGLEVPKLKKALAHAS